MKLYNLHARLSNFAKISHESAVPLKYIYLQLYPLFEASKESFEENRGNFGFFRSLDRLLHFVVTFEL
jgi:hypothetical protein